jgi:hypothetical protein
VFINTPKGFKFLEIRSESSEVMLTSLATFEVAVGVTVLAVKVEV